MADTSETPETPDIEARALEMGWAPKERWRGDPEKWVDAATFVDKGEHILPIVRANNAKLLQEQRALQAKLDAESSRRKELEKTVEDLAKFQAEEVQRQVKERVKQLRKDIKVAREAGNEELEEELEDQLEEARTAAVKPPKPVETPPADIPPAVDPAFATWANGHADWWEVDPELTSLAVGIATKLRKENATLVGAPFFAEVDKRMARYTQPAPRASKVEGGGPSTGGGPGNGRTYNDLPAEAKAQADKDASRFVGPGKLYKDQKDWRTHYANVYFGQMESRA